MVLWTIVDKSIYLESGYDTNLSSHDEEQMKWWHSHLEAVMGHFDFPEYVQFWTRIGSDQLHLERYNNRRFDVLFPQMWWDNRKDQNVILHPNPYIFRMNMKMKEKSCMIENMKNVNWAHQQAKAVFLGQIAKND